MDSYKIKHLAAIEAALDCNTILVPDDPRIELHELRTKMDEIVRLIDDYGDIDGDHHKQWVLDQIVRTAKGEKGYREWLADLAINDCTWDIGIAP